MSAEMSALDELRARRDYFLRIDGGVHPHVGPIWNAMRKEAYRAWIAAVKRYREGS